MDHSFRPETHGPSCWVGDVSADIHSEEEQVWLSANSGIIILSFTGGGKLKDQNPKSHLIPMFGKF